MNILILSVGTRVKIVDYFKKHLSGNGMIICTDVSKYAPALYAADKHYIVPSIQERVYLDEIIRICEVDQVDAVLSLIDPELLLLSENRTLFENRGIKVLLSDYELIQLSTDKFLFQNALKKKGFNHIESYLSYDEFEKDFFSKKIDLPAFCKPYNGSASNNIYLLNSLSEIKSTMNSDCNIMVQKNMVGQELGADVYIDTIDGKVKSIFVKEKIRMRAGETDKSISYYCPVLEELIFRFIEEFPYRGMIDIDIFKVEDKYYISEVNPRFGGGYPHGEEVGYSAIPYILSNIENIQNDKYQINKDSKSIMMKYSDIIIK